LHRHRHRHPRIKPHGNRRFFVILIVNETSILMRPNEETIMATIVTIGHKLNLSIQVLDQHGNPMLDPSVYDAEPVWANTTPATETLSVAAGGQTATGTPVSVGTDLVSLSFAIGGKEFTASLAVEVDAEPQVATSAIIVATIE
jgi:hypothetical protein